LPPLRLNHADQITAQPTPAPPSTRRSKRTTTAKAAEETIEAEASPSKSPDEDDEDRSEGDESMNDDDEELANEYDREIDDDDDPFGGPPSNLTSTLRALSGMMSGVHSRLRDILTNLKQKDDPSVQLIALQELSEILLVSTEDNLSGHFSSDQFIKELVILMQPGDFGEENPEMMLLACRCIANLMEALPASTANVVYGGAVPILCQKLLEIHFIDLAEQALSVCG
jgi:E3 ubiquitin-protein ligase TRIP12